MATSKKTTHRPGAKPAASSKKSTRGSTEKVVNLNSDTAKDFVATSTQACIECNNTTASFTRNFSSETFDAMNRSFADQVAFSKDLFSCRTLSELFELQNRFFQHSVEGFVGQSSRMSEMLIEYGSEAMEPVNEQLATATGKLQKTLAS